MRAVNKMTGDKWIIAIRLRQLGDLLATLEPLRALRASNARCRIALIADQRFHSLLARFEFIDLLIPEPPAALVGAGAAYARYIGRLRALRPAAAIDFHGNVRSALITLLCGSPKRIGFDVRGRKVCYTVVEKRVGESDGRAGPTTAIALGEALVSHVAAASCDSAIPPMPIRDDERDEARRDLADAGIDNALLTNNRVVGINPGRAYPSKEWPRDRFVSLARALTADGLGVVVMWGPGERDIAAGIVEQAGHAAVRLAPEVSLETLPGLLKNISALITIDSGLKHLAVSARVPTVTLFGSTDPREWHMGTVADVVLWKGFSCSPCRRVECPLRDTPCMDHTAAEVYEATTRILQR